MASPIQSSTLNSSGSGGELDFAAILPQIIDKFIAVLEGVIIVVVGIFIIQIIKSRLRKIEAKHEQQKNAINILEKISGGFIIVVAVTLALKVVGLDITLLVSVGLLGLSYGLQDIIKNYVAGILILFKAPFKIGEIVKIRSFIGIVEKMDFQSTTLQTFDNKHITIYNKDVMTQSIVNYSNNTMRRLQLNVTIGYGSDVMKAMKIFEQILKGYDKVLEKPKFRVVYKKFTESGLTLQLKFWVKRPCNILKIRTDIANMIFQSFDENNIYMPYGKGVEAESEIALGVIPETRKQRAAAFLSSAIFTTPPTPATVPIPAAEGAAPAAAPQIGPDGKPIPPAAQPAPEQIDDDSENLDWEEPE